MNRDDERAMRAAFKNDPEMSAALEESVPRGERLVAAVYAAHVEAGHPDPLGSTLSKMDTDPESVRRIVAKWGSGPWPEAGGAESRMLEECRKAIREGMCGTSTG